MKRSMMTLTNSRYYSATLNAAVFDGPFRIYFSQTQESLALNIYFRLQRELQHTFEEAKRVGALKGRGIYIMLYPTDDILSTCFESMDIAGPLAEAKIKKDTVLGLNAEVTSKEISLLFQRIQRVVEAWKAEPQAVISTPEPSAEL